MSATGLAADVAAVLAEPDVLRKIAAADALCAAASRGALDPRFERGAPQRPARPARVVVTDSLATRRRADLRDARGRRSLIHAVAHIELCAIELALLAVADFPGEERDYYRDMLAIAGEEALHARLLLARLHELGGELGEEPLHLGLWETAIRFPELPDRLAIVPRVLEAKGLDVSAKLRHELRAVGDDASAALLDRVYRDEIGHVAIGTRWHRVACARRGLEAEQHFLRLARPLRPRRGTPPPLDRAGRIAAGFTARELDGLAEPTDAVDRADAVDAAERTPR